MEVLKIILWGLLIILVIGLCYFQYQDWQLRNMYLDAKLFQAKEYQRIIEKKSKEEFLKEQAMKRKIKSIPMHVAGNQPRQLIVPDKKADPFPSGGKAVVKTDIEPAVIEYLIPEDLIPSNKILSATNTTTPFPNVTAFEHYKTYKNLIGAKMKKPLTVREWWGEIHKIKMDLIQQNAIKI